MKSYIPRHFVTSLLTRSDIVSLVETRVPLKTRGSLRVACCPFHQEKSPSFTVSADRQTYHCFGCGVHGNALDFIMAFDHLSFVEAVEYLANEYQLEIPYEEGRHSGLSQHSGVSPQADPSSDPKPLIEILEKAQKCYQHQLTLPAHADAIAYLKSRGLTGEIAKQFGIGYAPDLWDLMSRTFKTSAKDLLLNAGLVIQKNERVYDRFRKRIMFPIRNRQGRTIGFGGRVLSSEDQPKYLNSPETPVFHKGKELYGLYEALQHYRGKPPRIIVTEGYMDVIALVQFGFHEVVATLGTATTEDHLKIVFRQTSQVIFCFDGDRAGREAARRALSIALKFMTGGRSIQFLFLPEEHDPDSLLRQEGREGFERHLANAQTCSTFLLTTLEESLDLTRLDDRAEMVQRFKAVYPTLPNGPFLEMLTDAVAGRTRLSVEKVQGMLQDADVSKAAPKTPSTSTDPFMEEDGFSTGAHPENSRKNAWLKRTANPVKSLLQRAIDFLILHPRLVEKIPSELSFLESTREVIFFQQLIQGIRKHQLQNSGQLLPYIQQHREYQASFSRSQSHLHMSLDQIDVEFGDVIRRLQAEEHHKHLNQLTQKAKHEPLSNEERMMLSRLLQLKKQK